MAIVPGTKNTASLLTGFRTELGNKTNINTFDTDSKARAISDVFVDSELELSQEKTNAFYAMQLSNAFDEKLDAIGATWGVPRRQNAFAQSKATERSFAFYVTTGTFNAINGGLPFTLTAGTTVFSAPNNNESGAVVDFVVTSAVTCQPAEAIKYVSVRAVTAGSKFNVGRGVVRSHSFTGYADVANNSLKVVNFYPVLNGNDRESDRSYRYRLTRHYLQLKQNNDARLQLTALNVPGVLDTRIIPGYFGIGTVGVVVLGADNQSNTQLVSSVQVRLEHFKSPSGHMVAVPATNVGFDLEMELKTVKNLSTSEKTKLESDIRLALTNYLRSISIGGTVSIGAMIEFVQSKANGIVKLGAVGSDLKLFKNIYLRRGYSNRTSSEREEVVGNYVTLEEDEYASVGLTTFSYL